MRKLFTKTIFKTEERPLLQHLNSTSYFQMYAEKVCFSEHVNSCS